MRYNPKSLKYNMKKIILSILALSSGVIYAQDSLSVDIPNKTEVKISFLDSIKNSFVYDEIAACVDSLWMKELTNQDIFNEISTDIATINIDEKVDYPELSTELLKQRLKEMDARSPFNIEYNPGLENLIKSFLKNRKKSFERLMALSEYYFPTFEEALSRQNVPLEIKYLAIVESALNPKAVSRVGATGLWQFMYQTGLEYNLKVDSYVDERSDLLKSSAAAAQYMSNMYRIFGDWELVLASYNSGAGNVSKAIRRSGGKQNFWNIKNYLPKETQGYVPAFLATMYIYEYHKEHGIVPNKAIIKHFETDTIMIKNEISFKQISDLLDIPVAEIQLLNPSFKRNVIPAYKDKKHFLRLPIDKIGTFTSNEDKIYAYVNYELSKIERPFDYSKMAYASVEGNATITKTKYHTVKKGESLGLISNKYKVSINQLKKWNNLKTNSIAAGRKLKIQSEEAVPVVKPKEPKTNIIPTQENTAVAVNNTDNPKDENHEKQDYYVVQEGDNLYAIAKRFGLTVDELKELNNMEATTVPMNTKLKIIKKQNDVSEEAAVVTKIIRKNNYHIVQKGDNLNMIARKEGVTVADIQEWNNLKDTNIQVGNKLLILKESNNSTNEDIVNADNEAKKQTLYLVQKGDSLFKIAQKHPGVTVSDIKKWNDIKDEQIKPGMKLKING